MPKPAAKGPAPPARPEPQPLAAGADKSSANLPSISEGKGQEKLQPAPPAKTPLPKNNSKARIPGPAQEPVHSRGDNSRSMSVSVVKQEDEDSQLLGRNAWQAEKPQPKKGPAMLRYVAWGLIIFVVLATALFSVLFGSTVVDAAFMYCIGVLVAPLVFEPVVALWSAKMSKSTTAVKLEVQLAPSV